MFTTQKLFLLKIIYNKFFKKKDEAFNNKLLSKNKFDVKKINEISKIYNLGQNISFYYKIFSNYSTDEKKKILEIGTYKGNFTNFLTKIFPNSEISTIDIPHSLSPDFKNLKTNDYDEAISILNKNLSSANIRKYIDSSFNLLEIFEKNYFDFIFVDGDHLNPQVTIDIFQSLYLLKKGGIMITDDNLINKNQNTDDVNLDSYETLKYLKNIDKITLELFIKKISYKNLFQKKYVSFSIKK
jgi:predicted O-methyltransferase YrrM